MPTFTRITWSKPPGPQPTGYKVRIGTTPGGNDLNDDTLVSGENNTTFEKQLDISTPKYVGIKATNGNGDGPESAEHIVGVPGQVTGVTSEQVTTP